jgi:integrase
MTETTPTTVNRTLRRLPNVAYRPREYLTEKEVDRLIAALRDAAAILLAYRHGLRPQELCSLRWSQLANQGEDIRSLAHYLGDRNLQSTDRFAKFWQD